MKFVLAPDKYKGSLTGFEFCEAVTEGITKVFPQATIVQKPMADGGDGTIAVLHQYLEASEVEVVVNDPLFRPVKATYLYDDIKQLAFIEMAAASGLKLLKPEEYDCTKTTTFGTGELIAHALQKGAKKILLGIGGSATNDGGVGMATALGYTFLDKKGKAITPVGKRLIDLYKIDDSKVYKQLQNCKFQVACDVTNPLYGKQGAAYTYGPQKGASPQSVKLLDEGLRQYAKVINTHFNLDVQQIKSGGAAGGMGIGTTAFLNAQLTSGIELVKEIAAFDTAIQDSDWIITGEGKLDEQTFTGKTIVGVIASAKAYNIPVAAFCGIVDLNTLSQKKLGLTYATSIHDQVTNLEEAIANSYAHLVQTSYTFAKSLQ